MPDLRKILLYLRKIWNKYFSCRTFSSSTYWNKSRKLLHLTRMSQFDFLTNSIMTSSSQKSPLTSSIHAIHVILLRSKFWYITCSDKAERELFTVILMRHLSDVGKLNWTEFFSYCTSSDVYSGLKIIWRKVILRTDD